MKCISSPPCHDKTTLYGTYLHTISDTRRCRWWYSSPCALLRSQDSKSCASAISPHRRQEVVSDANRNTPTRKRMVRMLRLCASVPNARRSYRCADIKFGVRCIQYKEGPLPNKNNCDWSNADAWTWTDGLLEVVSSLLESGLDLVL